jgi:hypothetical protein
MRSVLRRYFRALEITPFRFLLIACAFHILFTISIFAIGRAGYFPELIDENGIGVGFSSDSKTYYRHITKLLENLRYGEYGEWWDAPPQFHVKVYSLFFYTLGPLLGYNILCAEPLNLYFFILILTIIILIGKQIFNNNSAIIAATMVLFLPSFLLQTTQLLRDPFFIAILLAFLLICSICVTQILTIGDALKLSVLGLFLSSTLWLLRTDMWEVFMTIVLATGFFLLVRKLKEGSSLLNNFIAVSLLALGLTLVLVAGKRTKTFSYAAFQLGGEGWALNKSYWNASELTPGTGLASRISHLRHEFVKLPGGTMIDGDKEFYTTNDIVMYLPRAALIGFFAPFPHMWLSPSKLLGLKGKLLSAAETLLIYFYQLIMLCVLWFRRKSIPVWLLFSIIFIGLVALGLVVINVSVLYRIRYVFWIMIMILAAGGIYDLMDKFRRDPSHSTI